MAVWFGLKGTLEIISFQPPATSLHQILTYNSLVFKDRYPAQCRNVIS